jgi:tRNA(adenine34) deaminase
MRMLTYFINRGGKGLSARRRAELERAKALLSERIEKAKERGHKKAA